MSLEIGTKVVSRRGEKGVVVDKLNYQIDDRVVVRMSDGEIVRVGITGKYNPSSSSFDREDVTENFSR